MIALILLSYEFEFTNSIILYFNLLKRDGSFYLQPQVYLAHLKSP